MQANELAALIKKHGKKVKNTDPLEISVEVNELLGYMSDSDIEGFISLLHTFESPSKPLQIDLEEILNSKCELSCWYDAIAFVMYEGDWWYDMYNLRLD